MSLHDVFNGFLLVMLGMNLGTRLEAAEWRSKAKSGLRMESKGKLYRVEEVNDRIETGIDDGFGNGHGYMVCKTSG